jgi:hypothetical protein
VSLPAPGVVYRFAESVGITTFKYANNMRLTKQQTQCFFELGHNSFESWVSDVSLCLFTHIFATSRPLPLIPLA